jgi:hypothetical protein
MLAARSSSTSPATSRLGIAVGARFGAGEAIARPFGWNFTNDNLEDLPHRIDAHDNRQPHALAA